MLQKIKTLLGIPDALQDPVIEQIVEDVTSHLTILLGKEVPNELEFIIREISIRRFQRLGSEGMKSELVEGHRVDFYELEKEFIPYHEIIAKFKEPELPFEPKRGKVMFF